MFETGSMVTSVHRTPELDQGKHHRAKLGFILMSTDLAAESRFLCHGAGRCGGSHHPAQDR